jgi:hypothetical protein
MGYWGNERDIIWVHGVTLYTKLIGWRELEYDSPLFNMPIIKAFLQDDDIQEIHISSGKQGFTFTLQKRRLE